jgi:hypothetical protein
MKTKRRREIDRHSEINQHGEIDQTESTAESENGSEDNQLEPAREFNSSEVYADDSLIVKALQILFWPLYLLFNLVFGVVSRASTIAVGLIPSRVAYGVSAVALPLLIVFCALRLSRLDLFTSKHEMTAEDAAALAAELSRRQAATPKKFFPPRPIDSEKDRTTKANRRLRLAELAAACDEVAVEQHLKQSVADIDFVDAQEETALTLAARRGCIKTVKVLLHYGANRNWRAANGFSAIDWARQANNLDLEHLLLGIPIE